MNNSIEFLIQKSEIGLRIDIFLSNKIKKYTRSYIKRLIKNNQVKINQKLITQPSIKLKEKDVVNLVKFEKKETMLTPKKIKLNIVYEDSDLLIINKPKGMVVHPGAGNYQNTLANALAHKYKDNLSNINGKLRPGIVHRIDKDTSGLLVVAKNNSSHAILGSQFSDHSIKRKYLCLIWGILRPLKGRIQTLIARDKRNRKLMTISEIKGKKAITNYKTIKVFSGKNIPKISFVECSLETGRTHQIRVHFKYKGTSLIGDKKYGKKNYQFKNIDQELLTKIKNFDGQALHAKSLEFIHPSQKKWISFDSIPPTDFKKMLDLLKKLSS